MKLRIVYCLLVCLFGRDFPTFSVTTRIYFDQELASMYSEVQPVVRGKGAVSLFTSRGQWQRAVSLFCGPGSWHMHVRQKEKEKKN